MGWVEDLWRAAGEARQALLPYAATDARARRVVALLDRVLGLAA